MLEDTTISSGSHNWMQGLQIVVVTQHLVAASGFHTLHENATAGLDEERCGRQAC